MNNKKSINFVNQIKKEYYKNWRKNNKDKIKNYNSKYWEKRAEKIKNKKAKD